MRCHIGAAERERRKAEHKQLEAESRLLDAQKALKTASPEVTAFKTLFDEIQRTAQVLRDTIRKIEEQDPETAGKLTAALHAFGASL